MHPDKDAATGADPKPALDRKEKRRLQQLARRERQRDLVIDPVKALELPPDSVRCCGKVKIRDEADRIIFDKNGKPTTRQCLKAAIEGTTVCAAHLVTAKSVRRAAQRKMLAMVAPAIDRLDELVHQDTHLPTSLGAVKTVLERAGDNAIGAMKKAAEVDTRPVINIGIAVGGINKPGVTVSMLDAPVAKGEVVGDSDDTTDP
jgi:hypothetical protein